MNRSFRSFLVVLAVVVPVVLAGCAAELAPDSVTPRPGIRSFVAEPEQVAPGESSVLRWEVTRADEIVLQPGAVAVTEFVELEVMPESTTTYRLQASNAGGSASAEVTVVVAPAGPGDQEPGDQEPGDGDPGDQEPGDGGPGDEEPGDGGPGDGDVGEDEPFSVLAFTRTRLYRHPSIEPAVAALKALGAERGFTVHQTEDANYFTDANLAKYDVVVFLMTSGQVLNRSGQQAAFERFIRNGGGFVGVHSAVVVEYSAQESTFWPWYRGLVGAYLDDHSDIQQHTWVVETNDHPATAHLGSSWERFDEIYNFHTNPRDNPDVTVLISVDTSTVPGNQPGSNLPPTTMGSDHPVAWYHPYDGGRSFYTAGGHFDEDWTDEDFLLHILGGLRYAAGR